MGRLVREERWVPVHECGERWAGRSKESAERAMLAYPVGYCYSDGAFAGGITHIEREVRYVTEWRVSPDEGSES